MQNALGMRTATLEDLQTRLPAILTWVRSGEDVIVKGEPIPRTEAEEEKVDWSKSAVFKRPKSDRPVLTQEDLDELFDDLRGPY